MGRKLRGHGTTGYQTWILEELYEYQSCDKSADVGPDRDPARNLGTNAHHFRERAQHLQGEPPQKHRPSRYSEHLEEDDEDEKHPHPDAGIKHEIRAEDSRNCPR